MRSACAPSGPIIISDASLPHAPLSAHAYRTCVPTINAWRRPLQPVSAGADSPLKADCLHTACSRLKAECLHSAAAAGGGGASWTFLERRVFFGFGNL